MNERDDLKAYLDGELPEGRAQEVRAALERDPDLREEYTFMKLLTKEIQDTATQPDVQGADRARRAAKRKPWYLRPPALAVQGVAALFLIGAVGSAMFPRVGSESVAMAARPAAETEAKVAKLPSADAAAGEANPKEEAAPPATADFESNARAKSSLNEASPSNQGLPTTGTPNYGARDVVKTGRLGVEVKDTKEAMQEATDTVKAMQGYVESSSVFNHDGLASGSMVLRVPAASYETLVNTVRRMGEVMTENIGGQDVTAPLADMQAREKVLRAEETEYVRMLRDSRRLQDVLDLRDRLSDVRQQIESIDAQRKALAATAALSTLTVEFTQKSRLQDLKPDDWFGQTTTSATNTLMSAGRTIVSGALYVAILSPVWVPVALLAWWIARRRKAA